MKQEWIWGDGNFVRWDDANVHILTHSLHYGVGAFEGIRCYAQKGGAGGIFRLDAHLKRLFDSSRICLMAVPFSTEQLAEASRELVRKNNLLDGCYLRPLVFMGAGEMGIAAENPVRVHIIAWKWGAYLGEEGVKKGIRAKVSSFRRPNGDALLAKAKLTGNYVMSVLARREAGRGGYNEAILLDAQGYVSEGSGQNIFMVHDGKVRTPPLGSAILAGVTRDSVITLLKDQGVDVQESFMARDELYAADEVFFTGTAAEVTPVREIDDRVIGTGVPGPVTRLVQDLYARVVRGEVEKYRGWITRV